MRTHSVRNYRKQLVRSVNWNLRQAILPDTNPAICYWRSDDAHRMLAGMALDEIKRVDQV